MDYKILYAILTGEIDNALIAMESLDYDRAYQLLLNACETCEDRYIKSACTEPVTREIFLRLLGYCRDHKDTNAYKALIAAYGFLVPDA